LNSAASEQDPVVPLHNQRIPLNR
jgi:hypothetical protein